MARHLNASWSLPDNVDTWEQAMTAILMDIRSELQRLNHKLECSNVSRALHDLNSMGIVARRAQRRHKRKTK